MFVSIRRYTVQPGSANELARRAREGFLPVLRELPGFVDYLLMAGPDDALATVSVFETRDGAEASSQKAAAWVAQNVAELTVSGPHTLAGEVLVRASAASGAFLDLTDITLGGVRAGS